MKLIYHNEGDCNQYSPFDSELMALSHKQNLLLVSPYVGLPYLKRLIKISNSWRLITDFQEWIISHPNKKQRFEIHDFINEHADNIKHIDGIHAKVLVTDKSAFLGSANFTEKGILVRTEMSASFSEQEKVEELKKWFQSLWDISTTFTGKQLFEFVKRNENINPQPKISGLKSPFITQKRKSSLVPLDIFVKADKDYEIDLIKAVKKTKRDKTWLNKYFDLVKEILTNLDIDENSQKITMSVTKELKMPISIGQRYIISPSHRDAIGLILPLEFRDIISDYSTVVINEGYFFDKKGNQEALWVDFKSDFLFTDDNFLFMQWTSAARTELNRTTYSGFRKFHNPFYFKAAIDNDYRQRILE